MTENKIATKAVRLIEKTIHENEYRTDQLHLLSYAELNPDKFLALLTTLSINY